MVSVQASIRAEVKRGEFPAPKGAEAFSAYAIAGSKGLVPEMETAARQTLDHPMTFEILGEGLRLFEGWALRDLVDFRKRCRDNFILCLDSFLEVQPPGPSNIWVGCPNPKVVFSTTHPRQMRFLPVWLNRLLAQNRNDLKFQKFTHPLDIHSRIRQEYLTALQDHATCNFCLGVHIKSGLKFCAELENELAQARDKVPFFFTFRITPRFTSRRYATITGLRSFHLGLTYIALRKRSVSYRGWYLTVVTGGTVRSGVECSRSLIDHFHHLTRGGEAASALDTGRDFGATTGPWLSWSCHSTAIFSLLVNL